MGAVEDGRVTDPTVGSEGGPEGPVQGAPRWMRGLVFALAAAVVVAAALLVWMVFTPPERVITMAERDVVWYEQRVAEHPDDWRARVDLAFAYLAAGAPERAIAEAERASSLERRAAAARVVMGLAYEDMADAAAAEAQYRAALELDAASPQANLGLARLYLAKGEMAQAGERLDVVLDADPGAADVLVMRAQVYAQSGDAARAREMYERALAFIPDYQAAVDGLAALGSGR